MSFNRLTIQSLQAERQRAAYTSLNGLGKTTLDEATYRPTVDYVKAGDVIRVDLVWFRPTGLFANVPALYAAFRQRLSAHFNLIALSPQEYWLSAGGNILIDVQPRGDYGRLADVVSVVMGDAQSAGLNVDVARTRGEFISKTETTGGHVPSTIPDPKDTKTENEGNNDLESFFNKLTASPVTLAAIIGGVIILVIAAKK